MPVTPPLKTLGQSIRNLRHEKGWSQSDTAVRLDISIPALSKIETGATDINFSRLEQIAHLFNMSAVQLMAHSDAGSQEIAPNELFAIKQRLSERESEIISLQNKIIALLEQGHLK